MQNYFSSSNLKIGILGGGQLGKMLLQEAQRYDFYTKVLDPVADAPARIGCKEFVQGSFNDYETVLNFGQDCDVLTIEIENVNTQALKELQKQGKKVFPQPEIVELIQNKSKQKDFYLQNKLPTSSHFSFENKQQMLQLLKEKNKSFPFVWKAAVGGYDGRGVKMIRSEADLQGIPDTAGLVEDLVSLQNEIAIVAARNETGEVKLFPAVEMAFHPVANMVEYVFCPATLNAQISRAAHDICHKLMESLQIVGILAVEMFVDAQANVLINEIAPRVHNSGHLTIEACVSSQFEQHLRAILGFPLGDTKLIRPAVMVNLTGEEGYSGPVWYQGADVLLQMEEVYMHLYGKSQTRPFRKMGHITITAENISLAKEKASKIKEWIKVKALSGTM